MDGRYELQFFDDVWQWIEDLGKHDRDNYLHVIAALERLQEAGPALRRPIVGAINGSRYRNMRELRPRSGSTVSIRLLFAFDPERRAIFLIAGDKATRRQWDSWYPKAIKEADDRYAAHLETLTKEEGDHGSS